MKKFFAVVVLGSLVLVGCDKPASSGSKKPPVAPPVVDKKPDVDAGKKATEDAAKKAADDAAKKADDMKKPDGKDKPK